MVESMLAKQLIPDFVIRWGIRRLLKQRLDEIAPNENQEALKKFIQTLKSGPIAVNTSDANEQHYEVPTEFYLKVLGPQLKYSSGFWEPGDDFPTSEKRMLDLTCERAQLKDGIEILELGCGWGSLTLWTAKKYPHSKITAVSNSNTQREYILNQAKERNLNNIEIITADMNEFNISKKFDRVVSVEMFEHMRNWEKLLERVHQWLNDEGKLFVHIFVHQSTPYLFEVKDESDWMSRYFFSGGLMPSFDLFEHFNKHFSVKNKWKVNGNHYAQTSEAWLIETDKHESELMPLFEKHYGKGEGKKWLEWWRVFFMSCAELFKYKNGNEWFVGHYLLERK
ncbi:MAG: class I SAM-dependent methyltransferase [Bacteriovoracaceae bacterium]|nr:class I SAM-dependent methyltransferase [Bacteriovoracaceae bacterium]